jgi:hypothetical protein
METTNKKSVIEKLSVFSPYYNKDSENYIEVTEWTNREGYDININGEKSISLHIDELEAINFLCKYLEYETKL